MYKCKGCGIEVIVSNGAIFKPCRCTQGIIAEAKATVIGMSKLSN